MKNTGFLIRFIDIGLILLFGFIWVSDITTFTHINMSGSDSEQQSQENRRRTILALQAKAGGLFIVTNRQTGTVECEDVRRDGLERCLRRASEQVEQNDRQAVVLINPSEQSAVQHTIDALDVCKRLGLPGNINKESLQL